MSRPSIDFHIVIGNLDADIRREIEGAVAGEIELEEIARRCEEDAVRLLEGGESNDGHRYRQHDGIR